MSRSLGSLTVDLILKHGGYEDGLSKAERATKQRMDGMVGMFKSAAGSFGIAFGGAAVVSVFNSFIANTMAAEKEQAQLAAVLKSTGEAAGFNAAQLNDMASSMQGVTVFSGGEITEAQTALLAFTGIVGGQFPRAMQNAADMASRTGMSIAQAAETIGRALDVPSQGMAALSRQGFRFTDDQKEMVKALEAVGDAASAQEIILSSLEGTYGGAAKASRETLGGALTGLKNNLDDLMTGTSSFPTLTSAVNSLADALASPVLQKALDSTAKGFGRMIELSPLAPIKQLVLALGDNAKANQTVGTSALDAAAGTAASAAAAEAAGRVAVEVIKKKEAAEKAAKEAAKKADAAQRKSSEQRQREVGALNNQYASLAASMREQIVLFGDQTVAAKVRYDTERGALAGLSNDKKRALIEQAEALDELRNQQSVDSAAADSATGLDAIRERYAEETDVIYFEMMKRQAVLDEARINGRLLEDEYRELSVQSELEAQEKIAAAQQQRLTDTGNVFGEMGQMVAGFAGKQSGIARALFAVQKAYAIANSIVAIQVGISQAAALPFPGNLLAMATVAARTAGIVSMIRGAEPSFEGGGYTGGGSRSGGVDGRGGFRAILHPDETVIDHKLSGSGMSGGATINVYNAPAGTSVERRKGDDGREIIDIMLADLNGNGPYTRGISSRFGLGRKGA